MMSGKLRGEEANGTSDAEIMLNAYGKLLGLAKGLRDAVAGGRLSDAESLMDQRVKISQSIEKLSSKISQDPENKPASDLQESLLTVISEIQKIDGLTRIALIAEISSLSDKSDNILKAKVLLRKFAPNRPASTLDISA